MVKSTIYKGIEFVRLSSLPKNEQEIFSKSFNQSALIKILIDEEIVHDCIQYKDYVLWHSSLIQKKSNTPGVVADVPAESIEAETF